jgi:hypothetical protein
MAAGFVPVPTDIDMLSVVQTKNGFFFGLCLLPASVPGQAPGFVRFLTIGNWQCPVIQLPAHLSRHLPATVGAPPDPYGVNTGTAACWAQPTPGASNPTGLPGVGILTAAHVAVDWTAFSPMTPGSPYGVVGYAIDAVVLYPESLPGHATQLKVRPAVAVGSNVEVFPQAGGSMAATILLTFQPSAYIGFLCPHRMIIDTSFSAGDSGSLVKDQTTNHAVGLYLGEIITNGVRGGACQIMQQVTTEFAIDLYL